MCGICGIIGIESAPEAEAALRRMLSKMIHRGPDDEGILVRPPVAAGMRRLSIIDLSGGRQPQWNETRTLAVIFNGEIYNFHELHRELSGHGHAFRTHSDTETIVHAYEQWGEDCVRHLKGMFAFAVLEFPEGENGSVSQIFLARDRLGIKPLYYAAAGNVFLFASEVRALLASGLVDRRVSTEGLCSYLLFGSLAEPVTMVDRIVSLPPGHSMTVLVSRPSHSTPKRFWGPPSQTNNFLRESVSRDSAAREVRTLLEDAVLKHLVADVPVGIFLSSGLDSTAIAALASRERGGLHTFTVIFPERDFSEGEPARVTAERLGTEHQELVLTGPEMLARLQESVEALDQPSMNGINTYFVSWAARQAGLKVALSGLGSDEIFGGYATFANTRHAARCASLARLLPSAARGAAGFLIQAAFAAFAGPDPARKLAAACRDPRAFPHAYFYTRLLFPPSRLPGAMRASAALAGGEMWRRRLDDSVRETSAMDAFTAVSWLELRSYMVQTLLRDTDSMSMRHSLEVRVPFLDHELVECALSLPESAKKGGPRPKGVLAEALGNILPSGALAQPKRTFTLPWERWLRGPLRNRIEWGLKEWSPAIEPVFSRKEAEAVWSGFQAGETSWSRPWALYVLNEWVKTNLSPAIETPREGDISAAVRLR